MRNIAVVGVLAALLMVSTTSCKKKESYRTISVSQLNGTVIAEENNKTYDAYANMHLREGHALTTKTESYARMVLDGDKYVKLEEDSRAAFEALGKAGSGKTVISLEQGALTNELTQPLSPDESYVVNTPNAVMAVRGTFFRVEVRPQPNGDVLTDIYTYGGAVQCSRVLPNGEVVDEQVIVDKGYMTTISMDTSDTIYVVDEISSEHNNTQPIDPAQIPEGDILDMYVASTNDHEMFLSTDEIWQHIEDRNIDFEQHTSQYDQTPIQPYRTKPAASDQPAQTLPGTDAEEPIQQEQITDIPAMTNTDPSTNKQPVQPTQSAENKTPDTVTPAAETPKEYPTKTEDPLKTAPPIEDAAQEDTLPDEPPAAENVTQEDTVPNEEPAAEDTAKDDKTSDKEPAAEDTTEDDHNPNNKPAKEDVKTPEKDKDDDTSSDHNSGTSSGGTSSRPNRPSGGNSSDSKPEDDKTEDDKIEKPEEPEETETPKEPGETEDPKEPAKENIPLDNTKFSDSVLSYLANQAFDQNQDGYLSPEELAAISNIILSDNSMTTLHGIEYLTSLTSLDLPKASALTTLDVSQNTALTTLNMGSWDTILLLPIANCLTSLESLNCSNTSITELDLSLVPNLTSLDCSNNSNLQSLDFGIVFDGVHLNLQTLDCSGTSLSTLTLNWTPLLNMLNVTDCEKLESLSISNAKLSALDLSTTTALKELSINNCGLTDLDLTHNTSLSKISINNNSYSIYSISHDTEIFTITGFDVSKISGVSGADWNGSQFSNITDTIHYDYKIDDKFTVRFPILKKS